MAAATCDALWEWSGHGTLPVVIDAASCTNGLLDDVKNYLDAEPAAPGSRRSRCWMPSPGATACSRRSPSPGGWNAPRSTRPAPPPTWG